MAKGAKSKKRASSYEGSPRFLLFLRKKESANPLDSPTKDNNWIEAGTLLAFCLVLIAILVFLFRMFGRHQS